MTAQIPNLFPPSAPLVEQVAFDRAELSIILGTYGRMVSAGEWRDYALSFLRDRAVFSAFRRAAETPVYRIEKQPKLRSRGGLYALFGIDGQLLKRANELTPIVRLLDRKLIRSVT